MIPESKDYKSAKCVVICRYYLTCKEMVVKMRLYDCSILIVDDEMDLLQMIRRLLEREGYKNIHTASNCKEAKEQFRREVFQMVLLDVMLPDGDGFSLFEAFRKNSNVPVIFLSARDEDYARLRGLGLGADDYITKPFLSEELLLRLKAVLRRVYQLTEQEEEITIGQYKVDFCAGIVSNGEKEYELTAKEFALLKKFCDNRGRIISINTLCDTLWPDGSYGYENSLMVHIRRLREKIEENPSQPEYLVTVRGVGYKLK